MQEEIRELQGQLGDINTLVDQIHTDADLDNLERAFQQKKLKNQEESIKLDDLISSFNIKEANLQEINAQLKEEKLKVER